MQRKHQTEDTSCECFGRLCWLSSHITLMEGPANIVTHLTNLVGKALFIMQGTSPTLKESEGVNQQHSYLSWFGEV
jgi:hypothetical protein